MRAEWSGQAEVEKAAEDGANKPTTIGLTEGAGESGLALQQGVQRAEAALQLRVFKVG